MSEWVERTSIISVATMDDLLHLDHAPNGTVAYVENGKRLMARDDGTPPFLPWPWRDTRADEWDWDRDQ